MPRNVRLRRGDAGLPQASVVNVSQVRTIDRLRLVDRASVLPPSKMRDVLEGVALLFGTEDIANPTS
jgi:mRNA interferase MazF